MFVNKKCHSFLRNDTLYNILFLYFYLKFLAATWANGGMGAYSVRKSQNCLAFGTFFIDMKFIVFSLIVKLTTFFYKIYLIVKPPVFPAPCLNIA